MPIRLYIKHFLKSLGIVSSIWILLVSIPILITLLRILFFLIFKTYKSIVRYTNTTDIFRILLANLAGSAALMGLNFISRGLISHYIVPISVVVMEFTFTTLIMVFYRLTFKVLYLETINPARKKRDVVIVGAGASGVITKRALDRDIRTKYNVLAFFDKDANKIGKKIENVNVYDALSMTEFLEHHNINFLIVAIQNMPPSQLNEITEIGLQHNAKVLVVPPVKKWINGELSFKQIKKVKIEDLLERGEIVLDTHLITRDLCGKTILITGAAGSIGSEIGKNHPDHRSCGFHWQRDCAPGDEISVQAADFGGQCRNACFLSSQRMLYHQRTA